MVNVNKLENFKQVGQMYAAEIQTWRDTANELQRKLRDLPVELKQLQMDYADPMADKVDVRTINRIRVDIDNCNRQLEDANQRIEMLEKRKFERLEALVPDVCAEYNETTWKNATLKIQAEMKSIREQKAIFLVNLTRLHKMGDEARREYENIKQTCGLYGTPSIRQFVLPEFEMLSTYSGLDRPCCPTESEIKNAYFYAKVPYWVAIYERTGIVCLTDSEAQECWKEWEAQQKQKEAGEQ